MTEAGMPKNAKLFCFGLGYSALVLARRLKADGWFVGGTCRHEDTRARLSAEGIDVFLFDRDRPLENPGAALNGATHILVSVPPDAAGDSVLDRHRADILALRDVHWIGYLSTTGVYGDTGGAPVDESALVNPTTERSRRRVMAEKRWLGLRHREGLAVHVFRLAGIYGPGRSIFERLRAGSAQRIDRPGHLFSRIHVEDIATVLQASIAKPRPGAIYNVCDDEPAAPADVTAYACRLAGVTPPPMVSFEDAQKTMTPMALSFWRDNRRIDNGLIKRELGVTLAYPTYKEGLEAIFAPARAK
ncbi:MAG: SDR family oxidoreductase [Rhodospirillales bacterium]